MGSETVTRTEKPTMREEEPCLLEKEEAIETGRQALAAEL